MGTERGQERTTNEFKNVLSLFGGYAVAQLVEAQIYKPKVCGLDSR